MSTQGSNTFKPKQDDSATVPKGSTRKESTLKSRASKSDAFKTPISSGKKDKKPGINLTPVESLLFFNVVRFNQDPTNVDWSQVAEHSNLKNSDSAKVRFRQVQKKYGLELSPNGRQMKRKTRVAVATADDDDDADDSGEDNDESEHLPVQKRPKNGSITSAQQGPSEQSVQGQSDSDIKQESPVRQVQMDRVSPAHLRNPSPQQQRGRGPLYSSRSNATFVPYNAFPPQHSDIGMLQGMRFSPHMSNALRPEQTHGMSQQQLDHLQNLRDQHRERAYNIQWGGYPSPHGQSEPQMQAQTYMMQPGGNQYGLLPHHTQSSQGYFSAQGRAGLPAPIHASAQSPAISTGSNNHGSSLGAGFNKSAHASPTQSLFDEMVQMPDSATSPAATAAEPASQSKTNQAGEGMSVRENETTNEVQDQDD